MNSQACEGKEVGLKDDAWMEECALKFDHRIPAQHMWSGLVWPGDGGFPKDYLQTVPGYEIRQDDIIVCTYPKSGTSWVQEVAWLLRNSCDVERSVLEHSFTRIPFLEEEDMGIPHLEKLGDQSRLIKTHLPYSLLPASAIRNKAKMVYCYRNPKDVAVSYYHFYRSNPDFGQYKGEWHNFLSMFTEGYVSWGNWFDHVRGWWEQRKKSNIKIISYEEMKRDPKTLVKDLAAFCNVQLNSEQLERVLKHTSFEYMRDTPTLYPNVCDHNISHFMRKGRVGDWKNRFSVNESEHFDRLLQRHLGDLNIPLVFDELDFSEDPQASA